MLTVLKVEKKPLVLGGDATVQGNMVHTLSWS